MSVHTVCQYFPKCISVLYQLDIPYTWVQPAQSTYFDSRFLGRDQLCRAELHNILPQYQGTASGLYYIKHQAASDSFFDQDFWGSGEKILTTAFELTAFVSKVLFCTLKIMNKLSWHAHTTYNSCTTLGEADAKTLQQLVYLGPHILSVPEEMLNGWLKKNGFRQKEFNLQFGIPPPLLKMPST